MLFRYLVDTLYFVILIYLILYSYNLLRALERAKNNLEFSLFCTLLWDVYIKEGNVTKEVGIPIAGEANKISFDTLECKVPALCSSFQLNNGDKVAISRNGACLDVREVH